MKVWLYSYISLAQRWGGKTHWYPLKLLIIVNLPIGKSSHHDVIEIRSWLIALSVNNTFASMRMKSMNNGFIVCSAAKFLVQLIFLKWKVVPWQYLQWPFLSRPQKHDIPHYLKNGRLTNIQMKKVEKNRWIWFQKIKQQLGSSNAKEIYEWLIKFNETNASSKFETIEMVTMERILSERKSYP